MPKWTGKPLAFSEFQELLLKRHSDCEWEAKDFTVNGQVRTAGRFVRRNDSGKVFRQTPPFAPDQFGKTLGPGTIVSWCKNLDLDATVRPIYATSPSPEGFLRYIEAELKTEISLCSYGPRSCDKKTRSRIQNVA